MGTTILLCGNSEKEQLAARIGAATKAFHAIGEEAFICYLSSDAWMGKWNGWWVRDKLKEGRVPFHRIHAEPFAAHTVDEVRRLLEVFPGSHTYVVATSRYHAPRVRFWMRRILKARDERAEVKVAAARGGESVRTYLREIRSWKDVIIHGAQIY